MDKHTDFSKRVSVHDVENEWQASPMAGVERKLLDRLGDEMARATTIVRYAPESHFSAHTHTGGEEFIVLDGVFQDEHGDYPAGSYVRNPPTSSHTPRSDEGCTIFVKLWQYDMDDRTFVRTDMHKMGAVSEANRPGVKVTPLFEDEREFVRLETLSPGVETEIVAEGGAEFLVLAGSFHEEGETFTERSWFRVPVGYVAKLKAGEDGAKIWVKTGHLNYVVRP
ncbi:cupin domain-containing protein [Kordiimonas sp. SCSIO 12603]|uniref:cupin domain-containing protein n=1 Tax=Kordiimonas sp. SCSIO 12603 TaxID=2829596 RepID=UPI002101FAB9|nr:cupin domain-containing protein [Kordiimonas sp. SCSIO 12603]UTW58918.1 cupin domain-containing protein [Kordiimonas sp. SCSIO 12603]